MITKLSHATIYVLNQDSAKDFYVNKLGFQEKMDITMEGGFRWLTVSPPNQPDLEIVLMEIQDGPPFDPETAETLRSLVKDGKLGAGVFAVDDCRAAYEELVAKGVEFMGPPEDKFYGIEAMLRDDSGNWFSMTQRKQF